MINENILNSPTTLVIKFIKVFNNIINKNTYQFFVKSPKKIQKDVNMTETDQVVKISLSSFFRYSVTTGFLPVTFLNLIIHSLNSNILLYLEMLNILKNNTIKPNK